jgi:hypothetical protein
LRLKLIDRKFVEMIQFQITPDRTADNKKVHDLFRSLSSFYASPLDVLIGKKVSGAFWWDVMIKNDNIKYYCTFPAEWKHEIILHLQNTWPLCSIEQVPFQTLIPEASDVCEMKYRLNNIFALKTDRRLEIEPLNSILSITHEMQDGDLARLSICAQPTGRIDWQDWAERMHKEFKKGRTPRRTRLSKRDIFISLGELITSLLQNALDVLHTAISNEPPKQEQVNDYEKRLLLIDGSLSRGTLNKIKSPTFKTYIRIASSSTDSNRQRVILRALSNSFNDLTEDNELEREDIHDKLKPIIIRELNSYRISLPTRLDFDKNVMSNEELGRLVEMPTAAIQDTFKDQMETLDSRQIKVPEILTKKGLLLGEVNYKKESVPVYMPIKNLDQLCLPTTVIGGMGSGKTKGFACNRAIEFVQHGFSSLIVDPAKSEVWEQIRHALPERNRRRILLGKDIISLDFREALRSPSGRGRLAQIILAFFDDNTDSAGAQTQRFLRAAIMGMKLGKLREIMQIFIDKTYREEVITGMKEGIHKQTLVEFNGYETGRQRQILAPILNRLDIILGDPYLEKCMESDDGIDMVDILNHREMCTVIDVPDRLNTREAKDILINLISFKIDSAMALRTDEFPFAVIYDEPHQYLRSAKLWENVAVESRKYRLAYTWLFHSWEQIPNKLSQIIKDAGPHFVLYSSSKATYKGLLEEISPFNVEDGLHTKQYHAICALKVGSNRLSPFIAHMTPPIHKD